MIWAVVIVVLFWMLKLAAGHLPFGNDLSSIVAVAFQVYVPLLMMARQGDVSPAKTLVGDGLNKKNSLLLLITTLVTFVPYIAVYVYLAPQFTWKLPPNLFELVILNLLVVSLPEEIFYRGFLQPKVGIFVTNIAFALAHWVGEYDAIRLLPFFPGLVFSFLMLRTKSIVPSVIYHAACNVLSEVLWIQT